ncbi:MAG: energy-coupling factor transporter transmembrane protein EcfT [Oribacterium sp.]|nr:energy-coupling factor transporter transmembrane protein EcfT [Oribacterium sp.]
MLEKWNPSVKMITVFLCVFILTVRNNTKLNIIVFISFVIGMLLFSDVKPGKIFAFLLPAFIAAFGLFIMGLFYSRNSDISIRTIFDISKEQLEALTTSGNMVTALQLATRLLAYAGMGILFSLTTDGEYFVRSLMHQLRLPPKFAYGILAAFYLLPMMRNELRTVQTAFRVRNMSGFSLRPKILFTMLVNSVRWSESVAMAMESKGFSGEAERTYHDIPKLRGMDLALAVVSVGVVAFIA